MITKYELFLESKQGWGTIYLPIPKGFVDPIRKQIGEKNLVPQDNFFVLLLGHIPKGTPVSKIERGLECDKLDAFTLFFKPPKVEFSDTGDTVFLPIDSHLLEKWVGSIFPLQKRQEDNILALPIGTLKNREVTDFSNIKLNQGYLKTDIIGYTNLIKEEGEGWREHTYLFRTGVREATKR